MAKRRTDPMIHATRACEYLSALGHKPGAPRLWYFEGSFWAWKAGGPWVEYDDDQMRCLVLRWLISERKTSAMDAAAAIVNVLKAECVLAGPTMPSWCPQEAGEGNWITVANGMLEPDRLAQGDPNSVQPPNSAWFSAARLPVAYEPTATCPRWLGFLGQALDNCEAKISLLQEWWGYCLTPRTNLHAGLFIVGPSGSGKSTVGTVMRRFFGYPSNVSMLPIEKWDSEFALRETQHKLLNVCDETQKSISKRAEAFLKWYLSGGEMMVNVKHSRYMNLRPTARLVVATNHWPDFSDSSDGIWRRILPLRMRHVVPPDERNPRLAESFDNEHSGILNWALEGLGRLNRRNRFTETPDGSVEVTSQKSEVQTARTWAGERIRADPEGFVPVQLLAQDYREWCGMTGVRATASPKELRAACFEMIPVSTWTRRRVGPAKPYGLCGASIRSESCDLK